MDFDALVAVQSGLGTAAVIVMNNQVQCTAKRILFSFPDRTLPAESHKRNQIDLKFICA